MKDYKALKIIASILFGAGVGICVGLASQNVIPGILVGFSLSICFAVVTTSNKNK
jgi:hypothetical protein